MRTSKNNYVYIIPCSGIGKSVGTVGRKATYKVIDELHPQHTRTTCLALLTVGDKDALKEIQEHPCIAIDGCPTKCTEKNVEASKGRLVKSFTVTDFLRNHRGLKPEGVLELNQDGKKLADLLAEEVAETVDEILEGEA